MKELVISLSLFLFVVAINTACLAVATTRIDSVSTDITITIGYPAVEKVDHAGTVIGATIKGTRLLKIEEIDKNDYLKGVVPYEIGVNVGTEASHNIF